MAGKAEKYVHGLLQPFTRRGWWLKKNTDWSAAFGAKEQGVDYNLAMASIQIEVKNTDKDGVLSDKPTRVQSELLDRHGGFVFLVMWDEGYPRLPEGGDGYLVPWPAYQDFIEATSLQRKSVRRHRGFRAYGADEYLADYKLEWRDGRFRIPPAHPFWDEVISRAEKLHGEAESIIAWRSAEGDCDVGKAEQIHVQSEPG
jgi:hypothetical protein